MTTAARCVLQDCREAVADIRAEMAAGGMSTDRWRRQWVLVATLLRAVGHVLKNIDGGEEKDFKARATIDAHWVRANAPRPPELSFIVDERERAIKRYKLPESRPHRLRITAVNTSAAASEPVLLTVLVPECVADGPFKGHQPLDAAEKAISWWDAYLDGIDAAAR